MKKLLFILLALLTLSSCTPDKDNYNYLASRTIERIDKDNNAIYVEDASCPLKGSVEDYYLNEEFKVGDKVNVFSYKDELIATKVDCSYIPNIVQNINPFIKFFNTADFFMLSIFYLLRYTLFLLVCAVILINYIKVRNIRYSCHFFSGIIGISSFVFYLLIPNVEYKGKITFDRYTLLQTYINIQGTTYPQENIYCLGECKQNCFVYQAGNKIFLTNQDSLKGEHPELLAPVVNHEATKNLKLTMIICALIFVLSLKSFYKMIKFVNNKFSLWASKRTFKRKKQQMESTVDSFGGYGNFSCK